MASSLLSTTPPPPTTTTLSRDSHVHKKKKKLHSKHHHHHQHQQHQNQIKWKSQTQQNLYSSKLRQALAGANFSGAAAGGRAVRETADRVLAAAARGKTRWSRAILTNRVKLNFRKKKKKNHNKRQRLVSPSPVGPVRSRKTRFRVFRLKGKTVPAVQKKVRFLGRLVPGCRKEPLPVILEEAIDYIPALEMQVRAMTALADLLLGSPSSSSGAGDTPAS